MTQLQVAFTIVVVLFSCGKLSLSLERTSISHFPACPCCCFLLVVPVVVVVQFQPHYNTFAFCSSQLNLRLLRDDWGGEGHQFQWQLAPVGINKVSAGRVSPPPGEFVIKQIGRAALKRERGRVLEDLELGTFFEFRVCFFAVKIAANVALIITNDFIYHISYVLC